MTPLRAPNRIYRAARSQGRPCSRPLGRCRRAPSRLLATVLFGALRNVLLLACMLHASHLYAKNHGAQMTVHLQKLADFKDDYGQKLAFSRDGQMWASSRPGTTFLWKGTTLWKQLERGIHIGGLQFSSDGHSLYIGSSVYDITAQRWIDPIVPPVLYTYELQNQGAREDFFTAYNEVVTPEADELILNARYRARKLRNAQEEYKGPSSRILLLQRNPLRVKRVLLDERRHSEWNTTDVNRQFIAISDGFKIVIWDRQTGQKLTELKKPVGMIRQILFSPDGKLLVGISGNPDHLIVLWETTRWSEIYAWSGHTAAIGAVAFEPQRPVLITGGNDHRICFWSTENGHLLYSHLQANSINGIVTNYAGDRLLISSADPGKSAIDLYLLK